MCVCVCLCAFSHIWRSDYKLLEMVDSYYNTGSEISQFLRPDIKGLEILSISALWSKTLKKIGKGPLGVNVLQTLLLLFENIYVCI